MAITEIAPLDPTSPTFKADVNAFFQTLFPQFTVEINPVIAQLNGAQASEDAAAASASAAAAAAESAAQTAGAVKWVSGTTYGQGLVVWSPLKPGQSYRRITTGSGAVDPSLDPLNWASIGTNLAAIHAAILSF